MIIFIFIKIYCKYIVNLGQFKTFDLNQIKTFFAFPEVIKNYKFVYIYIKYFE